MSGGGSSRVGEKIRKPPPSLDDAMGGKGGGVRETIAMRSADRSIAGNTGGFAKTDLKFDRFARFFLATPPADLAGITAGASPPSTWRTLANTPRSVWPRPPNKPRSSPGALSPLEQHEPIVLSRLPGAGRKASQGNRGRPWQPDREAERGEKKAGDKTRLGFPQPRIPAWMSKGPGKGYA